MPRKNSIYYKVLDKTADGEGLILRGPLSGRVRKGRGRNVFVHTAADGTVEELTPGQVLKLAREIKIGGPLGVSVEGTVSESAS